MLFDKIHREPTQFEIFERLRWQLREIQTVRPNEDWLGVFHYGSFNYGLTDEKSDLDVRYIYFSDESQGIIEYKLPTEEIVECISFSDFCGGLWEGQWSLVETLFTKYFFVNPKYINEWLALTNLAQDFIKYRRDAFAERILPDKDYLLQRFDQDITADSFGYTVCGYPCKILALTKFRLLIASRLTQIGSAIFSFECPQDKKQELLDIKRGHLSGTREEVRRMILDDFQKIDSIKKNLPPIKSNPRFPEFFYKRIEAIIQKRS